MTHFNSYAAQLARHQAELPIPTAIDGAVLLEEMARKKRTEELLRRQRAQDLALLLAQEQDEATERLLAASAESLQRKREAHEARVATADADMMAPAVLTAIGAKPSEDEGKGDDEKVGGSVA